MATISPADKEADRHAWARLQRARPLVEWDRSTLRRADLTGEGIASRVMAGRDDEGALYVGLVRPGREGPTNPQVLELGLIAALALGFHPLGTPAECTALDGSALEGCRAQRGKKGLTVTIDRRSVQRLHFNAPARRFDSTPWVLPPAPADTDVPTDDAEPDAD